MKLIEINKFGMVVQTKDFECALSSHRAILGKREPPFPAREWHSLELDVAEGIVRGRIKEQRRFISRRRTFG